MHSLSANRYRLRTALLALGLTLATPAAAQGSVTLYQNAIFGGNSVNIPLAAWGRNTPWALAAYGFNDQTTSLTWALDTDIAVTFYENSDGSGAQWRIDRDDVRNGLSLNIGATYNDTWSAFSWQFDDPSIGGTVTLYEHSGFGGISKRLPLSSYQEGALHALSGFNDKATGMVWNLQPDVAVTFYEHPNGTGREYTLMHDASSGSISAVSPYYNDKFSSFRWRHVDPAQGWVRFWTDAAMSGYQLVRYVSETGFVSMPLSPLGMFNQIDSVQWQVPIGTTIVLYDDTGRGRASFGLDGAGARDFSTSPIWHDSIQVVDFVGRDVMADLSDRDRPYDRNTYVMAHDAHRDLQTWATAMQIHQLPDLLDLGVRALTVEVALHNGLFYCVKQDYLTTLTLLNPGEQPKLLYTFLLRLRNWLDDHPRDVVTVLFDNHSGPALADFVLDQSVLSGMCHLHQHGSWPTLAELVTSGKRVVLFERNAPAGARIPDLYRCVVENELPHEPTPVAESLAIDGTGRTVYLMNCRLDEAFAVSGFNTLTYANNNSGQPCNFVCVNGVDALWSLWEDESLLFTRMANLNWAAQHLRAGYGKFGDPTCGSRDLSATSRPRLGTDLDLVVDNLGAGPAAFEFLAYGVSDRLHAGVLPLPVTLPPGLGGGCALRVSADVLVPLGLGGYPIQTSITMPANGALIGVDAFFQSVGLDASGAIVMSDGGRARLGMQ